MDWQIVLTAVFSAATGTIITAVSGALWLRHRARAETQRLQTELEAKRRDTLAEDRRREIELDELRQQSIFALIEPLQKRILSLEEFLIRQEKDHEDEIKDSEAEKRELEQIIEGLKYEINHLKAEKARQEKLYNTVRGELIILRQEHQSLQNEVTRLKEERE